MLERSWDCFSLPPRAAFIIDYHLNFTKTPFLPLEYSNRGAGVAINEITMDENFAPVSIVLAASAFAAHKHRDQRRKGADASPYINHPIAVANVLANEAGITDPAVLAAALLHDTIEDTDTTAEELEAEFGPEIAAIVVEVTDDKALDKPVRKQLQIEHAATLSRPAQLVKFADKICNIRDMSRSPPVDWSFERRVEYFAWAKQVVDQMRGVSPVLEKLFDAAFACQPVKPP
jgi:GTP diphosphokinase / guanosine-3',5'-bis(diphosphate) 3'-diphosphatase